MRGKFKVVFVLGGPGSGKGTQCQLIQRSYPLLHLSAGHLLRQESIRPQSPFAQTIQQYIVAGKIVPSHITIYLLKIAMQKHNEAHRFSMFLIDGFPRNMENVHSWVRMTEQTVQCPFMIHLVCDRQEMLRRLLLRAQSSNRSDDNKEVIRKRFLTYESQTMEVVNYFEKVGKVRHVEGGGSVEQIFGRIGPIFSSFSINK